MLHEHARSQNRLRRAAERALPWWGRSDLPNSSPSGVSLSQHPDEHHPERLVLLAVDQLRRTGSPGMEDQSDLTQLIRPTDIPANPVTEEPHQAVRYYLLVEEELRPG